ncbi:MAG: acyl--CoA ligase [Bacteroidales bacterium]|nr:acyl--CoA ligase [Bacteroidales bacterium]
MILEDYIQENVKKFPNKTAIIFSQQQISYKELWERITKKCAELPKGETVVFRASQSIDFLIYYFALHLNGSIAVPLEKDTPEEKFLEISSLLKTTKTPTNTADILFTTGTTGKSKGVMISSSTIIADAENLIEGQLFDTDLAFSITGPLNHIGSLSKIYPVIIKGATLIITEGMKDVNSFFSAFELPFKKFATFLVPSAIRLLLQFSSERLKKVADKIDFIETGAAPISQSDMQKLCEILPQSRLYNTYASTETGIISTYNFNDGKCIEGCLGKPMSNSKIIITDEGLISCTGKTIMSGYAGDEVLTSIVLKDNTIYTSDYGYLDENSMLRLLGRQDDVINISGYKVAPSEVESVVLSIKGILDCIVIGENHSVFSTVLKLLYVSDDENINKKTIAMYLKSRLEGYKIPLFYEKVSFIKRTFNGKLDRKFYRQQ